MTAAAPTADTGQTQAAHKPPLPPPLVHAWRHPLQWVRNKAELLVAAVVLAHIGMLIIVALYYLIFEIEPTIRSTWHHAVSNADLRHSMRDVAEGVLGGYLAQAIVWNHFTRSHMKSGRLLERARQKIRLPVVILAILASAVLGAVGFFAAYLGLHIFHAHASASRPHGALPTRVATIWKSNWDKKVIGYVVSLIGRRPMHVVFDDTQRWFAERRVRLGRPLRLYHPPTFRARYNWIAASPHTPEKPSELVNVVMVTLLLAGIGLAGYGMYVLTYVA